jgi:hypothetical protein
MRPSTTIAGKAVRLLRVSLRRADAWLSPIDEARGRAADRHASLALPVATTPPGARVRAAADRTGSARRVVRAGSRGASEVG